MKRNLLLFTFALVLTTSSFINKKETNSILENINFFSDTVECGTPERDSIEFENLPWYDNNQYLEDFLDSLGYPQPVYNKGATTQNFANYPTKYWIPIKFWVIRNGNGNGGATELQIRAILRDLNQRYRENNTLMQFYQKCSISYIDETSYLLLDDSEARSLSRNNEEDGAVNVFLGDLLDGNSLGTFYSSFFLTFDSFNSIFISRRVYENSNLFGTLSHEVGHYFGLDHTHQYSNRGRCRKEPIDRNREYAGISYCKPLGSRIMCESTGDALSDTPADPDLSLNFSCNYISGGTDSFGDSYQDPPVGSSQPSTINLMSYNQIRSCRNNFTRLQVAVMLHSIERVKYISSFWANETSLFDTYEPDNTKETADEIFNCETQDRNFHGQFNYSTIYPSCDDDWVRYNSLQNGTIDIYTSALTGKPDTNTIISVYDSNGNLIATNDDKSTSNFYSKVTINATSSTEYFIKVSNKLNTEKGYYQLSIGKDLTETIIQGPAQFCGTSETYTIPNLPVGATVVWTTSGSINISGSSQGTSVLLTGNSTGYGVLSAAITSTCGNFTITKNITIGYVLGNVEGSTNLCINTTHNIYSIESVVGATNYQWRLERVNGTSPSHFILGNGNSSIELSVSSMGNFILYVIVTTPCGSYSSNTFISVSNICGGLESLFKVYPNPANTEITIEKGFDKKDPENVSKNNSTNQILQQTIQIFNDKGELLKTEIIAGSKAILNIKDIPNGTYYLHITEGKETIKKQIIIEH